MSTSRYPNPLGILDPTPWSSREFIEYISKYLKQDDTLFVENEYNAGNKLVVASEPLPGGSGQKVTYTYQEVDIPVGSVGQFTAEYGKSYAVGEANMLISVTRKTYPLKSILFPQGSPEINEDTDSLAGYAEGSEYSQNVTNINPIDGNATVMATGGSFSDINDNGGLLSSNITRRTRHFYGLVTDLEVPDNATILAMSSNLGSMPSSISVDHGAVPTRLCIVTTGDVVVSANGFEIGMQKFASQVINPYAADPAYSKTYNVFIQTQGTFNPFTYKVN